MPDRKTTISVFRSIQNRDLVAVTAESTGESERNVSRFRRVLKGLERGESNWTIKKAIEIWSEKSISDMRLWATEEKIISPPVPVELSEATAFVKRYQLKELARFVSRFTESLRVPAPTAISGLQERRWPAPYTGSLENPPLIRVVDSVKGRKDLETLLTILPMPDLAPAVSRAKSSLLPYARTAKKLAAHIATLYADPIVGHGPGFVPPGVILSTMHFWVEACDSGEPAGIDPRVETGQGGSAILYIGGWSASFPDSKKAEQIRKIFLDVVQDATKTPEILSLLTARRKCKKAMDDACELLESIAKN